VQREFAAAKAGGRIITKSLDHDQDHRLRTLLGRIRSLVLPSSASCTRDNAARPGSCSGCGVALPRKSGGTLTFNGADTEAVVGQAEVFFAKLRPADLERWLTDVMAPQE
jgi:hypothetical protein